MDRGKKGWELVSVIVTGPDWTVKSYFKRLAS
jgi:hypothetical protein